MVTERLQIRNAEQFHYVQRPEQKQIVSATL